MDYKRLLPHLKTNLQINSAAYDEYLESLLRLSESAIERKGIRLREEHWEDGIVVTMYAAYLYRSRREPTMQMPQSLKSILNDMLFSQKAGG